MLNGCSRYYTVDYRSAHAGDLLVTAMDAKFYPTARRGPGGRHTAAPSVTLRQQPPKTGPAYPWLPQDTATVGQPCAGRCQSPPSGLWWFPAIPLFKHSGFAGGNFRPIHLLGHY